jgi:hypothetical protein
MCKPRGRNFARRREGFGWPRCPLEPRHRPISRTSSQAGEGRHHSKQFLQGTAWVYSLRNWYESEFAIAIAKLGINTCFTSTTRTELIPFKVCSAVCHSGELLYLIAWCFCCPTAGEQTGFAAPSPLGSPKDPAPELNFLMRDAWTE